MLFRLPTKSKAVIISGLGLIFATKEVLAQNLSNAFGDATGSPLKKTAESGGYRSGILLETVAGQIITALISLLGVIFMIYAVYGGYLYMTSNGNEEKTKKGVRIITQSLIGIIIILAAYAISYFIFKIFI